MDEKLAKLAEQKLEIEKKVQERKKLQEQEGAKENAWRYADDPDKKKRQFTSSQRDSMQKSLSEAEVEAEKRNIQVMLDTNRCVFGILISCPSPCEPTFIPCRHIAERDYTGK